MDGQEGNKMNTIQTSMHYVVKIDLGEVQILDSITDTSYTRRITVTDRDGVELELVLFSNTGKDDLEIKL